jgi:hypothetical protein
VRRLTMKIQGLRTVAGMLSWIMALSLAGCRMAPPPASADIETEAQSADIPDEAREVADASLGKQAEILARGNLAQNGREQILVVNRLSVPGTKPSTGDAKSSPILVTRAVVLEKNGSKWTEILRCDEHLKNPNGYLGGLPTGRIDVWNFRYDQDLKEGLEIKLASALIGDAVNVHTGEHFELRSPVFDVRWNKKAKRYETYDQSHERYLNEVPSLETPQSTLR